MGPTERPCELGQHEPYLARVSMQAYNKKLLSNILPVHVAEFFMSGDKNNDVSQFSS